MLFANADAGDIVPGPGMCNSAPQFDGSVIIAKFVQGLRNQLNATTTSLTITAVTQTVDFGPTDLNYTLARFNNCTSGGPLDICTFCKILDCGMFLPRLLWLG